MQVPKPFFGATYRIRTNDPLITNTNFWKKGKPDTKVNCQNPRKIGLSENYYTSKHLLTQIQNLRLVDPLVDLIRPG